MRIVVDVVCVGTHPDDVEIAMGATVASMVRLGLSVALVDLTDGEPTPAGSHEQRLAEATEAASILGVVERVTLSLPNRSLFDTVEARTAVAEVLRRLRPRILFGPLAIDAHPDHVAAAAIVRAARFWAKFNKTEMSGEPHYPERIYSYMAIHLRIAHEPSFVVDVTEDLPVKIKAVSAYRSQFVSNPSNEGFIDTLDVMARYWGECIGTGAGEPFFAEEVLGIGSIGLLV